MNVSKFNSSLRVKIFAAFALMSLLATGVLTTVLYENFSGRLRDDIRDHLGTVAALAALQIDPVLHDSLTHSADEGNAVYRALQMRMQAIQAARPEIHYVYTMRAGAYGEIRFVVDAETRPELIAHLDEVYDDPGAALVREFATLAAPLVEDDFYTDKFGTQLSGYAPFLNANGQRAGIVGVDISADNIGASERRFLFDALTVFLAMVPLLLLASWLLSRRLSNVEIKAKTALKESEEKFRSYIASAPHGVFVVDEKGGYIDANHAVETITGYTCDELLGMSPIDLIASEDQENARKNFETLVQTGKSFGEFAFLKKDGTRHYWVVRAVELSQNRFLGFVVDITDRKVAEAERVRLMAAIEQSAETVVITDVDGTIEYVNPVFEQTSGYTSDEALGQNISILESDAHDAAFHDAMWETLLRGEVWSGQFINKKKEGTLYTENATISPVRDASGQVVNYVAVKRDITDELNLEEQFRQAQKMQSIGQLVAGIAHDFNNLMQVINGYADIARKKLQSGHDAGESIGQIRKAGDQAKSLVKQLLAFSRQQVIDPVDLDLNELIKHSWKMLRHMIGEHIQFEFSAGEDLGTVFADRSQIEQVLMNLCVNARDAMPNGGTLTVQTETLAIDPDDLKTHTWAQPGDYVLLSVRDTGCGMGEETLKKVFEPFFTTKDVGEGTGLGLSTVYGIVKQSEGHIDVTSEPGKGATFKIYLPVSQPLLLETLDAMSEGAAAVEDGVETLLVAEDEEVVLRLATQILREAGYTVLTARDGEEAVRVFEEHADEIDCVIMDVVMPRMSGKDAMEKMLQKRPALRHLFVTGYSPDAGHIGFIKETGAHLLEKPYEPNALLQKIRSVLDED